MSSHNPSIKVFLADDSELIRTRIAAMLGMEAMAIVGHAQTPQAAIEGIRATRPDVVVLDVQLDGGSGLEVLNAIHPTVPEVAFIVFSSHSGPAYRERYLRAGAAFFLDKSTEFDILAHAIGAVHQIQTH